MNAADRAALTLAADVLDRLPSVLLAELGRRGVSQTKAAEQMGVDRQTVNRWINRRATPYARDAARAFRWLAEPPPR